MPFANITKSKEDALRKRMATLGIRESDLDERFTKGSGKGGQKLNKSSNCVVLKHKPSEISTRCQKTRSQSTNRFFARRALCDLIEASQTGKTVAKDPKRDKIRKQKQRRQRRSKSKLRATSE